MERRSTHGIVAALLIVGAVACGDEDGAVRASTADAPGTETSILEPTSPADASTTQPTAGPDGSSATSGSGLGSPSASAPTTEPEPTPTEREPTTTATTAPATPPAQLVAHLPTGTGSPGAIVVLDSTTGATIRTLGAEYDPYLMNGFQMAPDGSAVYYTRLDEPAQTIEIVMAPVDGSLAQVVAEGTQPQLTTDGLVLADRTAMTPTPQLVVHDLASGTERTLPHPGAAGDVVYSTAWTRDSRTLIAVTGAPIETCRGGLVATPCPTQPAPAPWRAWSTDITAAAPTWTEVIGTTDWTWARLLGPGPEPGSLLCSWNEGRSEPPGPVRVGVVDSHGDLGPTLTVPDGVWPLDADAAGANILVTTPDGGLGRITLTDATPVTITGPIAEASW